MASENWAERHTCLPCPHMSLHIAGTVSRSRWSSIRTTSMFPTTSRVPTTVYESLVGSFKRPARQKGGESLAAILATYECAHHMVSHIPSFSRDSPGDTPGQLIMTNTNHQKNVISAARVAPALPPNTPNPLGRGQLRGICSRQCWSVTSQRRYNYSVTCGHAGPDWYGPGAWRYPSKDWAY